MTQNITVPGFQKVENFSHVVELFKYKNENDLLKIYPKRYRRYINKAKKLNLIIKEASSLNEYEKLYELHQKNSKYWHKDHTNFPLKLFQNLYRQKNKYMRFWVVYKNNEMLGGDITFYWNQHCFDWISYYDREYSDLRAARYRLHIDYMNCKAKGIKFYDLGESAGISGLELFKRSMGGKEYPHIAWLKENSFLKKLRHIKSKN